jgi:predicted HAD superfamily hydrolase
MNSKLNHYQKVLKKNPAHYKSVKTAMEELESVSPFYNEPEKRTQLELKKHILCTWAPVLTEFAVWIIKSAIRDNVDNLYFLSRDAYPVYMAAKEIITNSHGALNNTGKKLPELHYLRVSRYALRIPEMAIRGDDFLDMMFLSGIDVTMRKILNRGGLDKSEIDTFVKTIGFEKPLDVILSRPEIMSLKEKAREHKNVLEPMVQAHGREELPLVMGYLRQEGILGKGKNAIVDSGWIGTTQRSLQRLMNLERPDAELYGYYFGLYEVPKDMNRRNYKTFYFAPDINILRKSLFSNCLFEAVSSEPKGMTIGYNKMNNGKYEASISDNGSLNEKFLRIINDTVSDYASAYAWYIAEDNDYMISGKILPSLMTFPDKWEALMYGNLLFCDDVLEDNSQHIAADLSYQDICNLRLIRKTWIWLQVHIYKGNSQKEIPQIHESGWLYGSIVKRNMRVRWSILCAVTYNWIMYLRKWLGK